METKNKKDQKVETKDGSETYESSKFGEAYHSYAGAVEESFKKYVEPCKIRELAKKQDKITILDFCFGFGYNSAAAIELIKEVNPGCKVEIIALDDDKENFEKIKSLNPELKHYELIKDLASLDGESRLLEKDNVRIFFVLEDARVSLKFLSQEFDAVFFDPFSPKNCPALWTQEVFEDIYELMKKKSILSTFSCSRWIRKNMENAGFKVQDGVIFGRKSPGTIAIKD